MHDIDALDRNAEPPGDDLRERRLVSLSMAVASR
jgi:hypothetical protein